jgi:mono/diheme cytochrome c family protein
MRKVLKWIGIAFGVLVGLVLVGLAGLYVLSDARLNQRFTMPAENVPVPTDPAEIEHGRHLVSAVFLCTQCHGQNLAGSVLFEDTLTARLAPSNLTAGRGGVGQAYTDVDWVNAIRHGIRRDGRPGIAMLSNVFYPMSDADLGAMIAYLKSMPPVDNVVPPTRLGLLGRFYVLQTPDVLPAATINHTAPRPSSPAPGVTAEYGHYLAGICTFCHGPNYAGSSGPRGAANLTPVGDLAHWTEADFLNTLRTGKTPDGKVLKPDEMPWSSLGQMTDDELKAVWLFLKTLPPAQPAQH